MNTAQIIIPARLASTRLPRKLLLRETGKSLIQHTYEAARRSVRATGICVATDHAEIFDEVRSFGGQVEMTNPEAPSGTDRVAEVARRMTEADIIVNVQGDEPEIAGRSIDLAIELLENNPIAVMSTLATPIRNRRQLEDPACVKVVFGDCPNFRAGDCPNFRVNENGTVPFAGRALYFSRSVIPHPRQWDDALLTSDPPTFFQHVGLYAYRRDFLLQLASMPPCRLEQIEKLEQLRVLDAGHAILVGVIDEPTFGIDTPEDYRAFVEKQWQHSV
jgi:3-deoxy-manno-octulosonate cytidylyltransferase (CMP-KDO synthetase)